VGGAGLGVGTMQGEEIGDMSNAPTRKPGFSLVVVDKMSS
jgi:hypothetical protein